MERATYRILTAEQKYKGAGTDSGSWFDLATARTLVNREAGEMIVEHNGMQKLWEVL